MSGDLGQAGSPGGPSVNSGATSTRPPAGLHLEREQWRQLALITVAAIAIFVGLRLLPTGTNLSHMDFRVDPKAGNVIEFCDPLNPQFIPVVTARSPVTMTVTAERPVQVGHSAELRLKLTTGSGKPIAPEDLLITHTRRLHLLIIDPTLRDYHHVHPEPARRAGEWTFAFKPRANGPYRVFADFTPAATARGLYASAELPVAGASNATGDAAAGQPKSVRDAYTFALTTAQQPPRAGQPIDLHFTVTRKDGGPLQLERVMDALAHLVAFDRALTGFAHLHPAAIDLSKPVAGPQQALDFKLTIPRAGDYVVWAQLKIAGEEVFVPFELTVQ